MNADLKIFASNVEPRCIGQINVLANCEAFSGAKIRIMPDCHSGKGCVIGFTADLGDKVIPNVVGVDIGCGMYAVPLMEPIQDFEKFDKAVREVVPMGFELQSRRMLNLSDSYDFECIKNLKNKDRLEKSLGTLGSGNHFVEVDEDEHGNQTLVIHTGSRNLGLQVCNIYQKRAEKLRKGQVPKGLEWLDGDNLLEYVHDMREAQKFATANRERIANAIAGKLRISYDERNCFHTVHNYLASDNVIRKGAISANAGEKVLIPLNMRDGSVIAVGKGNKDWNCSAPHGAGRAMSRKQAFRDLDVSKFNKEMYGIYSSSVCKSTLDEAPEAYKPASDILPLISDTVEVVNFAKPVYNAKAMQ